jgi:hypothetical protein
MKMKYLFSLLLSFSFFFSFAQDISYATEEEHAVEWLAATTNFTGPEVGSTIPSREFTTTNDKAIRVPDGNKKLYVLHFWSVGCGAFPAEKDNLRKLQQEFKDNPDVSFISFVASSEEEVKNYVKEQGSFGYELIATGTKANTKELFGVAASTTHMLIDTEGKIIENFTTVIDFDEMYDTYKNKIRENL